MKLANPHNYLSSLFKPSHNYPRRWFNHLLPLAIGRGNIFSIHTGKAVWSTKSKAYSVIELTLSLLFAISFPLHSVTSPHLVPMRARGIGLGFGHHQLPRHHIWAGFGLFRAADRHVTPPESARRTSTKRSASIIQTVGEVMAYPEDEVQDRPIVLDALLPANQDLNIESP
jgi:hypothetical protein